MWKDLWEQHAAAERAAYDQRPIGDLLQAARSGQVGSYHTLWDAIAARATLEQAGWTLLDVLASRADYLDRYHCAAALLKLLNMPDREPVDFSADWPQTPDRVAELKAALQHRVPRPDRS